MTEVLVGILFIGIFVTIIGVSEWNKKLVEQAVSVEASKWIAGCFNAMTKIDKGKIWLDNGLLDEYPQLNNPNKPYYYLETSKDPDSLVLPNMSDDAVYQTAVIANFKLMGSELDDSIHIDSDKHYPEGSPEDLVKMLLIK